MTKLLKYLKKYTLPILFVIGLLYVQASTDLALPSYTAKIVDVGIQQGGIESTVPDAILGSRMAQLTFLADIKNAGDGDIILNSYTRKEAGNLNQSEFNSLKRKYPAIENEPIYILKDTAELSELEAALSKPMLIMANLSSNDEKTKAMKAQALERLGIPYTEEDFMAILAKADEQTRTQAVAMFSEYLQSFDDSMIRQGVIQAEKSEYAALGVDIDSLQIGYIVKSGALMLGIALIGMAASIAVAFLSSRLSAAVARDMRGDVFKKVVSFSSTEFEQFSTASLITRSTNDIQQVQMLLVQMLRVVFYAPILGVGGVLKVLNTNTNMAWIIALAVGILLALVLFLLIMAMPKFKLMQKLVDKLNLVTREILTGLPVIRAFSTQKHEEKRFDKANVDLTKTSLFVNRVMTFMMPTMMLIMNGISILIEWKGASGINSGAMQTGDLMAFIQYSMQIIMSFLMISMMSITLPRASVSIKRISEVLSTQNTIKDPETATPFDEAQKGIVEFKNVSFRYPGAEEDVLSDIDFIAKPGQTTAFIGSTGSGKSTLINLIPRFYDVTKGQVLVDGADVRSVKQHDLNDKIGYVPQRGVLFSGTIKSNIKYSDENISDEQMEKATRIAQAAGFVSEKEKGYDSEISQGGTNVSGGQKQRLSIARAVAKNPEIYIFDDSFSALDYKTDVTLRKALKDETGNSTVIIVAQRINTILHADQIIVLDEGTIVGKGTHEQLLQSCEEYKQIALSQLSKEELAL